MIRTLGKVALRAAIPALLVFTLASGRPASAGLTDARGDFLGTYVLEQAADLDVRGAGVIYDPAAETFTIFGRMDGAVGTTAGALYVFGFDRGEGTARFLATLGLDGVLFDSVVVLSTAGGNVVDLVGGVAPVAIAAADITVSGNTISTTIDASLLADRGLSKPEWTFNLWPRLGTGNVNQISDFAPDNANFRVLTTPEPTTLAMLGVGGLALAIRCRRARAAR